MEGKIGRVSIMTLDGGARVLLETSGQTTGEQPVPVNPANAVDVTNSIRADRIEGGSVRIAGRYGEIFIEGILPAGEMFVSEEGGMVKVVHEASDQRVSY